jgi:putative hydrolase of the HAD superfamily
MIVIFDLDDTLYDEIEFVHSGFHAVANFLQSKYGLDYQGVWNHCLQELTRNGRGKIFNNILDYYGIFTNNLLLKCISVYRMHDPDISLKASAVSCLSLLDFPKYIVTDGNKCVQHNKLRALNVSQYITRSFVTHDYGIKHAKPSSYCFMKILQKEKVTPQQAVYIGDNPYKDFVGIKPLGLYTIRILNGMYKDIVLDREYEADITVQTLNEVPNLIKQIKG